MQELIFLLMENFLNGTRLFYIGEWTEKIIKVGAVREPPLRTGSGHKGDIHGGLLWFDGGIIPGPGEGGIFAFVVFWIMIFAVFAPWRDYFFDEDGIHEVEK